jgi:hypothetical protein
MPKASTALAEEARRKKIGDFFISKNGELMLF